MYKLISLDLDGTLLNSKGIISERNLKAIDICHQHGMETVIATGRPPRFTFSKVPEHLTEGYCVCYNGARIYHHKRLLMELCIEHRIVQRLIEFSRAFKVAVEVNDVLYANCDLNNYWPNIHFKNLTELTADDKVCKVLIINHPNFPFDEFDNEFSPHCTIVKTDQNRLIEIMNRDVSKQHAIQWISDRMHIDLSEIIAFGDDHNDLEILSSVGLGIAMMNSNKAVKSVATTITASNDDDGVAITLEKIIEEIYE